MVAENSKAKTYIIPPVIQTSVSFQFSKYIFSADVTPEMLKLRMVTNSEVV